MKYIVVFILFNVFNFVVWTAFVFGGSGNPSKMSQWIFDAYEKKEHISHSIKSTKVVVVAGSNALFGINSKILSNALGKPVLNDGVNAGIELPCVLHQAKKVINKGDLVIMPLEYPMYSYDGTPGLQMIDYVLSREMSCFFNLSLKEQVYILWHVSFKRVWDGYFNQSTVKTTTGLYGPHHIDNNGDQINTQKEYRTQGMHNEVINNYAKKPEEYGAEFDKDAIGWRYLSQFVNWCEKRNVKVIFMPSTLLKQDFYFQNREEKWFYENIANEVKKMGWKYVGNPYDYMYDKEMYFDTNFHLINQARDKRTEQMIQDLLVK